MARVLRQCRWLPEPLLAATALESRRALVPQGQALRHSTAALKCSWTSPSSTEPSRPMKSFCNNPWLSSRRSAGTALAHCSWQMRTTSSARSSCSLRCSSACSERGCCPPRAGSSHRVGVASMHPGRACRSARHRIARSTPSSRLERSGATCRPGRRQVLPVASVDNFHVLDSFDSHFPCNTSGHHILDDVLVDIKHVVRACVPPWSR